MVYEYVRYYNYFRIKIRNIVEWLSRCLYVINSWAVVIFVMSRISIKESHYFELPVPLHPLEF